MEELDRYELTLECTKCGHVEKVVLSSDEIVSILPKKLGDPCPKCGNVALVNKGEEPLGDVLIREAERVGTKVELISKEHEAGEMFLRMFGGIAGVLKSARQ